MLTSGVWSGYYEQVGRKFPQEMTLEFADGLVRGDGHDALGTFAIDGEYRLARGAGPIGWIKTYDGAHSVLYLGTLSGDTIGGTWRLRGGRGSFALTPRPAQPAHPARRS